MVYAGNDLNDLSSMLMSGFSFAPCDAHHIIQMNADFVSNRKGGDGFVRDVVETLLRIDTIPTNELLEYI